MEDGLARIMSKLRNGTTFRGSCVLAWGPEGSLCVGGLFYFVFAFPLIVGSSFYRHTLLTGFSSNYCKEKRLGSPFW